MPIGEDIDIPASAYVRCPLVRFRLRWAGDCPQCHQFRGLTEVLRNAKMDFEQQFHVRCASPIERELFHVIDPG